MDEVHIDKLRRFSLAVGLVLITYAVAGVELASDNKISLAGASFTIKRPELFPVALVLASIFSAVRFWYYGLMVAKSPARRRAEVFSILEPPCTRIDAKARWERRKARLLGVYFRASEKIISPERFREFREKVAGSFPRVLGQEVRVNFEREDLRDEGSQGRVLVNAPSLVRWACLAEQVDYTSPVWLNGLAILTCIAAVLD